MEARKTWKREIKEEQLPRAKNTYD